MVNRTARAGEMRERIALQDKGTPTRDGFGAEVITWETVATVWAKEVPFRGQELLAGAQEAGELLTRFAVRYRPGITSAMRITKDAGDRIFDILSVVNVDARNKELLLMCREVLNG